VNSPVKTHSTVRNSGPWVAWTCGTLSTITVITLATMTASFLLLSLAMRTLPLGTAYTVWTGIGAVGAFGVGVVVLSEPAGVLRTAAALLIVCGLVLMKVSSPS